MRLLIVTSMFAALLHAAAWPARAQTSVTPLETADAGPPPAGWSFTPALDYAFVWDSNVLIQPAIGDNVGEQLHVVKPRVSANLLGRRGKFGLDYVGGFVQHPKLSSLNSFDQRLTLNGTRSATRRLSFFGNYSAAISPTTELVELPDIPFARVGTRRQDLRAGVVSNLSRRLEATAGYRYEYVKFDEDPTNINFLNLAGGHAHGAYGGLRYGLAPRLALTGDYDMQRATIVTGDTFAIQNSYAGLEYQLAEYTRVYGSAGLSYLSSVAEFPARSGPALRLGFGQRVDRFDFGASYSRSYVPSYGFGGTSDNEELNAHVQFPIARRVSARTSVALRSNEPLEARDLKLRTVWFHTSVGYVLTDWARLEVFGAGSRQEIDRPGGRINRYTVGIQITAARTTRIR